MKTNTKVGLLSMIIAIAAISGINRCQALKDNENSRIETSIRNNKEYIRTTDPDRYIKMLEAASNIGNREEECAFWDKQAKVVGDSVRVVSNFIQANYGKAQVNMAGSNVK